MANPDLTAEQLERLRKPARGDGWMRAKQRRAERRLHERQQMDLARKRDMAACHGCRWPQCEFMSDKPRLEVSHCFEHRGSGGNPDGTRTMRDLLMLMCFIHHDRLDAGDAEVQPLTSKGTDAECTFHEKNKETGRMEHIATERSIGISTMRQQ